MSQLSQSKLIRDYSRADAEDQLLELRLFVPPPKTGDEDNADALKEVSRNTVSIL